MAQALPLASMAQQRLVTEPSSNEFQLPTWYQKAYIKPQRLAGEDWSNQGPAEDILNRFRFSKTCSLNAPAKIARPETNALCPAIPTNHHHLSCFLLVDAAHQNPLTHSNPGKESRRKPKVARKIELSRP
ncbi:hypothetical protein KC357_g21 [Hortaea werneckii]|nr:hypothetical protein KC357_g21 [Hortaea werneckii]